VTAAVRALEDLLPHLEGKVAIVCVLVDRIQEVAEPVFGGLTNNWRTVSNVKSDRSLSDQQRADLLEAIGG
jgi:hypothetical protein